MKLSEWTLDHPKIVWFLLAVALAGGIVGFDKLGQEEDAVLEIGRASWRDRGSAIV